jgi:SAM-dependent methyltransferase
MDGKIKPFLKQLLSIYWLRPETALWRTLDCALMIQHDTQGRGADFGCGSGILSYVMAGGKMKDYDDFMNVSHLNSYMKGADIYNSKVLVKPSLDSSGLHYTFSYGIDHKMGLLHKARHFNGFYEHTLQHDLNKPLPLPKGYFDWGFSNILYWLQDPSKVLRQWGQTLKSGGRLYLFVPNQYFKRKAWLYYKAPHRGDHAYLNYFDRGYNALIRHGYSQPTWQAIFQKSGFRTVSHRHYLSNPVMEIWNIGLRPISHLLIDMTSRLSKSERDDTKLKWTTFFEKFFLPVLQQELAHKQTEKHCAFHFFILENR